MTFGQRIDIQKSIIPLILKNSVRRDFSRNDLSKNGGHDGKFRGKSP
jgi:hypothetical protein